jgi:hypothetical protein
VFQWRKDIAMSGRRSWAVRAADDAQGVGPLAAFDLCPPFASWPLKTRILAGRESRTLPVRNGCAQRDSAFLANDEQAGRTKIELGMLRIQIGPA